MRRYYVTASASNPARAGRTEPCVACRGRRSAPYFGDTRGSAAGRGAVYRETEPIVPMGAQLLARRGMEIVQREHSDSWELHLEQCFAVIASCTRL